MADDLEEFLAIDEKRQQLAVFFPTLTHDGLRARPPIFLAAARRAWRPASRSPAGPRKVVAWWWRKKNSGRPSYRNGWGKSSTTGANKTNTRKKQRRWQLHDLRLRLILKRNGTSGRWRRAWQARQVMGRTAPRRRVPPPAPRRGDKRTLPLPLLPPPLAPCLQCVLAGTTCSLTTKPYRRDYTNDRVQATPRPGAAAATRATTTSALWKKEHARLVRVVSRVVAAQKTTIRAADPNWKALNKALARRRQALEQRVLRLAVVRGECDAPFLARPPVQCARCVREGETACLQQSADMTALVVDVAWFASSGPPPVSLLPQHGRPLAEQMAVVPWDGDGSRECQRRCRPRTQPLPPLRLEAVFCRDPSVLSAPAIAAKAKHLLAHIAQKPRQQQQRTPCYAKAPIHALAPLPPPLVFRRPRPATPRELTRLLPRRSPYNPYAGRGVATALLSSSALGRSPACPTEEDDDDLVLGSAFAPVPPPIPCWNKYDQNKSDADGDAESGHQQAAVYNRREYFLDVGEQRTAAILRRQRQEQRFGSQSSCLDDDDDTLPSPLSPSTPPPSAAYDYTLPDELRHCALLQHALELYGAASPAAGTSEGVPTHDDEAGDPCFPPLQDTPPSPVSSVSPHTLRNYRPWSEEQAEALQEEEAGPDARTKDQEDDAERQRWRQQQQQQELRVLANRFGVSLERLAEHRRQQLRCRTGGKSG